MQAMNVESSRVLGIAEVARMLGLHPGSLRRAEREGRVPRARREAVSGTRVYSHEDVEALRVRLAWSRSGSLRARPFAR